MYICIYLFMHIYIIYVKIISFYLKLKVNEGPVHHVQIILQSSILITKYFYSNINNCKTLTTTYIDYSKRIHLLYNVRLNVYKINKENKLI